MMVHAYLNNLGVVCALGTGIEEIRTNMLAGSSPGMVRSDAYSPSAPCHVGSVLTHLRALPKPYGDFECRNNRLLLAALDQIDDAVRAAIAAYGRSRVGVVLGTSTSGIALGEAAVSHFMRVGALPDDYRYRGQRLSSGDDFLSEYLAVEGPSLTLSTACSSSAHALSVARRLIRHGVCDAVVTGGADALSKLTVRGFQSLSAVSHGICNPLSRNRDGINVAEGAALFLMTRDTAELELLGAGASSDAHHISAPAPDGRGALAAMRGALADAGIAAEQVDYINLHGTGTPLNDAMECIAIAALFGTAVTVSSTKPLTGHALGAAGAIELALCCIALQAGQQTPPHCWDGQQDPALPALNLVRSASSRALKVCLSNSFAFGGNNAALLVGRSV